MSCDFAALLDVADSAILYTFGHLRTNNMLTLHSLQATITRFRTRVARRVLAFSSRRAVKWRLSWLRRSRRVLRLLLRTFSCFALCSIGTCDVSCLEDLQRTLARGESSRVNDAFLLSCLRLVLSSRDERVFSRRMRYHLQLINFVSCLCITSPAFATSVSSNASCDGNVVGLCHGAEVASHHACGHLSNTHGDTSPRDAARSTILNAYAVMLCELHDDRHASQERKGKSYMLF